MFESEPVKVVQELLRHANSRLAGVSCPCVDVERDPRAAQSRVANLILPKKVVVGESLTKPFQTLIVRALTDRRIW